MLTHLFIQHPLHTMMNIEQQTRQIASLKYRGTAGRLGHAPVAPEFRLSCVDSVVDLCAGRRRGGGDWAAHC